jgi:hypothetical protein
MSMRKIIKNICTVFKNDFEGIFRRKIFGEISIEYLGSISEKKFRRSLENICRIF